MDAKSERFWLLHWLATTTLNDTIKNGFFSHESIVGRHGAQNAWFLLQRLTTLPAIPVHVSTAAILFGLAQ